MTKNRVYSIALAIFSVITMSAWAAIVIFEIISLGNKDSSEPRNQTIFLEIESKKSSERYFNIDAKYYVSLIIDDVGDLDVSNIISYIPNNVAVGLSVYNKNIESNIRELKDKSIPYFIKLPIYGNQKESGELGFYENMPANEIETRLEKLYNTIPGSKGFYNMGENSNFLNDQNSIAKLVQKISSFNVIMLYGTNNNTVTLEPYGDLAFMIAASDLYITTDDNKILKDQLKSLEGLCLKKHKAIGVLSANKESIHSLYQWSSELKNKNIEIIPMKNMITKNRE